MSQKKTDSKKLIVPPPPSSTLTVTTTSDSGIDATIGASYVDDLADGSGLSLREALYYISASGTIEFESGLNGQTITLGSDAAVNVGVTLDADAVGALTISAQQLKLAGELLVSNGSGDTLTISSVIANETASIGALTKNGAGTVTLAASNTYSGTTTVSAGTLSIAGDANLGTGALTLNGGTLAVTGSSVTIDNAISLGINHGMVSNANTVTLSGAITGTGTLTKTGVGTLTLDNVGNSASATALTVTSGSVATASDGRLVGGTVTLDGGTLAVTGVTTIDNAITLGSNHGTVSNASAVTLSGNISGTGNLTKSGAGTLTFSNTSNSTAAGTLTVIGGAVSVANDNHLLGGAVTLNGGTLTVTGSTITVDNDITLGSSHGTISNANALTLSGVISGTGNLVKSGAGALTLSGTNTYTGTSSFAGGTINISSDSNLGGGSVTLGTNTNFTITQTATIDNNIILNAAPAQISVSTGAIATLTGVISETGGARGLNKGGAGTLVVGANATYTGTTGLNGGIFELAATTTLATSGITLNNSSPTLKITGTGTFATPTTVRGTGTNSIHVDDAVTLSGLVSLSSDANANRTLTKTGTGTLTLGNSGNAAAGTVTSGLNTYTLGLTVSGGTVSVAGDANLVAGTVTLNGGTLAVTGSGALTIDNALSIGVSGGAVSYGLTGGGNALTLTGLISGSGTLTKTGAGTLILDNTGNSAAVAALTVTGGAVAASTDSRLVGGTVTLDGGALIVAGANTYDNLISLGAGGGTINGALNTSALATLTGIISGTGALTKIGIGTVRLNGINTYSGTTTISEGFLEIGHANALGSTAAGTVVANGTGLGIDGVTIAENLSITGSGFVSLGALLGKGISGVSGTVTLGGHAGVGVVTGGTLTISGAIDDGASTFNLTKVNASGITNGTLVLSGANNYDGTTTINAGTLVAAHNSALGTVAGGTTVGNGATLAFSSGVSVAESVIMGTGGSATLSNVSGDNILWGTITATNNYTVGVVSGSLTLAGQINTPSWSLSKSGTGTLVLSGTGSTIDGIIVNSGTLLVTGSVSSGATVAGTLGGTGIVTGNVTVSSGGTLAPGIVGTNDGVGTLTENGNLALNGTLLTDISGTIPGAQYDQILVNGTVTITGATLTPSLSGSYTPVLGNSYTLIDNDSVDAVVGTFTGLAEGATLVLNGITYQISYTGGSGNDVTLTVINTAPVLDASQSPVLTTIAEDVVSVANTGTTVADLVVDNSITDIEGAVEAIAVTEVDNTHGVWQYSTDNGATWSDFSATTGAPVTIADAARLLDSTHKVRFIPDADYNGTATITFRAWDKTTGTAGNTSDTTSNGGSTAFSTATDTASVTVTAVNDAPVITSAATGIIAENAATTTVVYTATATDVDASQTLSYSLSGTDAALFDINAATGAVTLKAAADFETKASYSLNVIATDNGSGNLTDTKVVTINVTDVNEAPVISSGSTGTVAENAATTTVVYTATATDVDASQTLSYSLSGTDAALFDINAATGAVTLKAAADFETKASYSLNVIATDNGSGNLTDTKAVTINVTDVNEAPVISSGSTGTVAENAATTTVVYTATATDVDASQTLSYSLSGTDAALFDINAATGVVTLKATANFETKASYSLNVIATDNGTGNLTDTKAVTINVTDVNEAPVISSGSTAIVAENAATTTVVYTATATDVDASQTLSYSLSGTDAALFDINAATGAVTLKAAADFETKASYSLNVIATDNGSGNLTDNQAVTITVTDVNEAPVISSGSTGTVAENAATTTVVYTVTATDVDASQTLSYSLSGTDAALFDINAATGAVTLKAAADLETKASYSLNVMATDNGTGNLTDTKAVTINVTDVNEAPVISSGSTGTVAENAATTTVVYTATATDVDASQTLSYSLSGTDAALFDINAATGAVTLKAAADFETKASYSLNVIATDNGTGNLTDTKAVTINVTDVNEAPVISSGSTGTVAENAATTTVVYTATATDVDASQTLSYSLSGTDAALFDINDATGAVTLKAAADFETKASYSLNVIATDNGSGNLTDNQAVTITVTDVNDAPVISSGSTGTVAENAATTTVVYTATATDVDASQTLSYSLSGTDAALFDINAATGAVTLKAAADFETKASYSLNVIATDNGSGNLTDNQAVTITVTDVNDAPVISSGSTGTVAENAATTTVVYTATATDVDVSQTLSYSLSGTDAALFDINAATGAVTLKAAANFETKASYSLNVIATDNGTGNLTDTKAVTINVTDVSEAPEAVDDHAVAVEIGGADSLPGVNPTGNVLSNDFDNDSSGHVLLSLTDGGAIGSYGTLVLNSDGSYVYTLNNNNLLVQALNDGDHLTESFNYKLTDSAGLYDNAFLTITIQGQTDAAADQDGVSASTENAFGDGDFNGDGIQDAEQSNITTLPLTSAADFSLGAQAPTTSFGALIIGDLTDADSAVTLANDSQLTNISLQSLTDAETIYGTDVAAELETLAADPVMSGLLDFTIQASTGTGLTDLDLSRVGVQTRLVIELPEGVTTDTYYKIGKTLDNPNPHVYAYMADGNLTTYDDGAELIDTNDDGDFERLVLTFTDGATGDDDLIVNQQIVDPGFLGTALTSSTVIGNLPDRVHYAEGQAPALPLTTLTLTGSDELTSVALSLDGFRVGDYLRIKTIGTGLTAVYDKTSGVLNITGRAATTVYQQVLHSLKYIGREDFISNETRTLHVLTTDSNGLHSSGQTTLAITPSIIIGTPQTDHLVGTFASDLIKGREADDAIQAGNGADRCNGNAGNDTLRGGLGHDTLIGGGGNDRLYGGKGDDGLRGNNGDDDLLPGLGNDTVYGHGGNDLIAGSVVGNDHYYGGSGNDTIDYSASGDGVTVDLTIATAQVISIQSGTDVLTGIENLVGSAYADVLTGNAENNRLSGGLGSDTLTGGAGADRFIFNAPLDGISGDTITDFESGVDGIELSATVYNAFAAQLGDTIGLNDHLSYDSATGELSYDADGFGAEAALLIAVLGVNQHPALLGGEFLIIA